MIASIRCLLFSSTFLSLHHSTRLYFDFIYPDAPSYWFDIPGWRTINLIAQANKNGYKRGRLLAIAAYQRVKRFSVILTREHQILYLIHLTSNRTLFNMTSSKSQSRSLGGCRCICALKENCSKVFRSKINTKHLAVVR